ncbi:MAG: hypothetical protein ACXW6K_22170 [Candidatus Binatia bacterium]
MIATQRGAIDATEVPVPSDLKTEELGLKRLLRMVSILPIPQAGFATTEEKIKTGRQKILNSSRRRSKDSISLGLNARGPSISSPSG